MSQQITRIFHLNSTCELAIANGSPYYVAPALLREFEEELASVMIFFSGESDFILKEKEVHPSFISKIAEYGFPMPTFISKVELKTYLVQNETNSFEIISWGNSPAEQFFIEGLLPNAAPVWHAKMKALYERETSLNFLKKFIEENPLKNFPSINELPQKISSVPEIQQLQKRWGAIVLKSPISSSGRGLQVIRKELLNRSNIQWIETMLKQQGYLIAEKWHNKLVDLSFQFNIKNDHTIEYIGPSFFTTNSNGQYSGHFINYRNEEELAFSNEEINEIGKLLRNELSTSVYAENHQGHLGIDAIIYLENAKPKFQPCIEINARYNMGILAKRIENFIHPEAKGIYHIYSTNKVSYMDFEKQQTLLKPPVIENNLLRKGFVSLTPSTAESKFGAYIELF